MPKPLIVIATSLLSSACSFSMQGPPRDYRPAQHGQPNCTDSKSTTKLDGVGAGTAFSLGVVMALVSSAKSAVNNVPVGFPGQYPDPGRDTTSGADYIPAGILFATGVTYAIAASHGSRTAARCRQAETAYQRARHRNATGGYAAAASDPMTNLGAADALRP